MPVAHSIGWSALYAALPLFVLLFLLAILRKPAWISAIASLVTAILVAWLVYRMPAGKVFSATLLGIAYGLLPTGWITFNAIFLYRLTLATGQFEVIKNSLVMLTSDIRLQALLIAFAFGAFVEGAAGSGVPVAVCAAMLAGMGFNRLKSAGICLLANTAPVAFGAIGLPIIMLQKSTGLDLMHLSAATGRISAPLSLCVPAYMVVLVAGWKGLRGVLPAALICGVMFAIVQVTVSNLVGPQLTDILAAIVAIICLVLLFRVWQPKEMPLRWPGKRLFHAAPSDSLQYPDHHLGLAAVWAAGHMRSVLGHSGHQQGSAQDQHRHRVAVASSAHHADAAGCAGADALRCPVQFRLARQSRLGVPDCLRADRGVRPTVTAPFRGGVREHAQTDVPAAGDHCCDCGTGRADELFRRNLHARAGVCGHGRAASPSSARCWDGWGCS